MFYSIVKNFFELVFKFFYRHRAHGRLPSGAAILAANHSSYFDPILVCISSPQELFFVARNTLFKFPIFSFLIKKLNALPVNQQAHDTNMFKKVLDLLARNKKILFFPEGKRSFDGKVGSLEKGVALVAIKANCPIVPTYISGAHAVWPRKNKLPKLSGKTACSFGKPIVPQDFKHLKKKEALIAMTDQLHRSLLELEKAGGPMIS